MSDPYIFDEFFNSGKEESISPFLTEGSKTWAKNLSLKSALLAGLFLLGAFISSFYSPNLSSLLLLLVYFLSGTPALLSTIDDLRNLEVNIDVLMTLAAFLSFLIGSQMEGGLLLVLFAFSGAMEETVSRKAKGALIHLNRLCPNTATILDSKNKSIEKAVRDIEVGAHLLVKAGEVVSLDGLVMSGHSFVNLAHLTGESVPLSKKVGDEVQAGSRNLDGTLTIQVTRTSQNSTLSKIIELINQAQEMKPKVQRFLDRFGKYYAITIISLASFFTLAFPSLLSIPFSGVEGSIYRALAFLIAGSPCALIIATPIAYLSAISACARKGILLKGGVALDAFASCQTIAFDKTGTLTTGKLTCHLVEKLTGSACSIKEALSLAASLERHVNHPMAEAITLYAQDNQIPLVPIEHFKAVAGLGLEGKAHIGEKEHAVWIGNQEFIAPKLKEIDFASMMEEQETMVTFLLVEKTLFALHFLDTLRPQIAQTLKRLRDKEKLSILMLTGDHQKSAESVAQQLNIDTFYADLRPENKLDTVSALSQKTGLAMVGDGINDAPALARARVGISLGKIGSATAVDASDIVFLHDDLNLIDWLYRKARKTTQIVRENLILALGVIVLTTTPALLGFIPLWLAVILHEGGTVFVGLNSLRLLKK